MSDMRKYGSNNESVDLKSADAQKKDGGAGTSVMSGDVKKIKMLSVLTGTMAILNQN